MDPSERLHPEQVEVVRIRESQKTKRYLVITTGLVAGFGVAVWGAVRMTDKPAWLTFALAVLAALGLPSGLLAYNVRFVWRWTVAHMAREATLESAVDPGRTSSTLNPDGTDPPEALP